MMTDKELEQEFINLSDKDKLKRYIELHKMYENICQYSTFSRNTVNRLCDILLGENWYCIDSGSIFNTDPILIRTVEEKYGKKSFRDKIKSLFEN